MYLLIMPSAFGFASQLVCMFTLHLSVVSCGPVPAAASPLFIVQQVEEAVQLQVAFELI